MATTALEAIQEHPAAFSDEAKARWSYEQMVTIWSTVAKNATFHEFAMFVALAEKYDLDPLAKEIWFAKDDNGKVLLMTGRDGLMKIARRQSDFINVDYDVHREKDEFRVIRRADGTRTVEHSYEGTASTRGPIVGAWAQIERRVMVPGLQGLIPQTRWTNYTYTPIEEYSPKSPHPRSSWANQRSAMICKCAVSLALRIAYGMTGIVGEDEMAVYLEGRREGRPATEGEGNGRAPSDYEFHPRVRGVLERAAALGHPTLADPGTAYVATARQDEETIEAWVERAERELDDYQARDAIRPKNLGDGSPVDAAPASAGGRDQDDREPVAQPVTDAELVD